MKISNKNIPPDLSLTEKTPPKNTQVAETKVISPEDISHCKYSQTDISLN